MRLTILLATLPLLSPAFAARNPFHYKRQSTPAAGNATAPAVTCTSNSECAVTEFCNNGACTQYGDCRGSIDSCPGGSCVSESPGTDGAAYICSFPSPDTSSSAVSSAESSASSTASSSASESASSTSSAGFPDPSTVEQGIPCNTTADCPATSFCNGYGHGINACAYYTDCRGPGAGCPGGQCISSNATDPGAGFYCDFTSSSSSLSASMTASSTSSAPSGGPTTAPNVTVDCRVDGCAADEFCSYEQINKTESFICFSNATYPAVDDCRVGGCPGGLCGFNGDFFQCFFDVNITKTTEMPSSSTSASVTESVSVSVSVTASPSMTTPPPPPPSSVVPPPPPASSSAAPPPPPDNGGSNGGDNGNNGGDNGNNGGDNGNNGGNGGNNGGDNGNNGGNGGNGGNNGGDNGNNGGNNGGNGSNTGNLDGVYALLYQIRDDLAVVKTDVAAIKVKLEL